MKRLIFFFLCLLIISNELLATDADTTKVKEYNIENYKGNTYIFDANEQIDECSNIGVLSSSKTKVAISLGSRFTVVHVDSKTGDLTIRFLIWKLPKTNSTDSIQLASYHVALKNRMKFNFKAETEAKKDIDFKDLPVDTIRYFLLPQAIFTNSCSEFIRGKNWSINYGTFTSPFKLRPSKSSWSNNLNLGTSVSIQYSVSTNWSIGGVVGLSLSSVTLDSASTSGRVKTNTDRPALTPSFSLLASYKNINFTFGSGIDFINRPSIIEQSWIFNAKPWLGFGIGVNLFTNSKPTNTTTPVN